MARRPHEEAVRPPRRLVGLDKLPVALAWGKHLFPFRTEKLSPTAPMVLGPHGPGRVGRRRSFFFDEPPSGRLVCVRRTFAAVEQGVSPALPASGRRPDRAGRAPAGLL